MTCRTLVIFCLFLVYTPGAEVQQIAKFDGSGVFAACWTQGGAFCLLKESVLFVPIQGGDVKSVESELDIADLSAAMAIDSLLLIGTHHGSVLTYKKSAQGIVRVNESMLFDGSVKKIFSVGGVVVAVGGGSAALLDDIENVGWKVFDVDLGSSVGYIGRASTDEGEYLLYESGAVMFFDGELDIDSFHGINFHEVARLSPDIDAIGAFGDDEVILGSSKDSNIYFLDGDKAVRVDAISVPAGPVRWLWEWNGSILSVHKPGAHFYKKNGKLRMKLIREYFVRMIDRQSGSVVSEFDLGSERIYGAFHSGDYIFFVRKDGAYRCLMNQN